MTRSVDARKRTRRRGIGSTSYRRLASPDHLKHALERRAVEVPDHMGADTDAHVGHGTIEVAAMIQNCPGDSSCGVDSQSHLIVPERTTETASAAAIAPHRGAVQVIAFRQS